MTVVASYGMVLCGNSDDHQYRYRGKIEKVKFGVPINEAFAHDIPATLLILLLKVNKEGPLKKDIWRAPGNQAQVRKLSHIMQHGRLVNIANFSVYTAASVIKKFLSKLPGGIFGVENEQTLFNSSLSSSDPDKQRQVFYRIFCSLPVPSQHLLVLLFGTFRMVADSADSFGTKMTPDAIAISVAPSLFHSCIHDGRQAKVEDVQRFKLASQVVKSIIVSFGHTNLFPRECYEFYARITGRTLRVDENWLFTFQYPSNLSSPAFSMMAAKCAGAYSLAALHLEHEADPQQAESPRKSSSVQRTGSLHRHPLAHTADHPKRPAHNVVDVVDLKQSIRSSSRPNVVINDSSNPETPTSCNPIVRKSTTSSNNNRLSNRLSSSVGEVLHETSDVEDHMEMEALRPFTACAGDTGRSLSCLDWVHENQARRMKSRSDWFLTPFLPDKSNSRSADYFIDAVSKKDGRVSENRALIRHEVLLEEKLPPSPVERQPLSNRKNSQNELNHRKSSNTPTAPINISGWGPPPSATQSASAITRRRSWLVRGMKDLNESSAKTHSLDYPNPPSPNALASHAHSVGGEIWITDISGGDEIPKKRRSLKKKVSTHF
ncbi:unnamed protein product [Auanema sp. JU1783]|nr:unnamed protein product [Auanema sp. JU1783]